MPATYTDRRNGLATSVAVKAPCRAVTSSNITLSGLQTIGGVTLEEGDRVLVIEQTTASENGIYTASTGSWSRARDFDGALDAVQGTIVIVHNGTVDGALYELTTANPITIGTTSLEFSLRYGANTRYDQTVDEQSASVTPTDTSYPELNILRYGADPTGGASSDTAIRNAIKVARAKRAATSQTAVEVFWPDGMYTGTQGIPLVTGVVHRCSSQRSATYLCTGSGAGVYTATYSSGTFTDNLDATIGQVQSGAKEVANAGLINLFIDHTGSITGNAPSGAAWAACVQIVGAPAVLLDKITVAHTTNSKDGISLYYSWRANIIRPWTPRQSGRTGGTAILLQGETNSVQVDQPFVHGAWSYGIDCGVNSATIVEPNIEFCTVGVRLTGVAPRLIGGYYEGNGTDIRLGIASSPVNRAFVQRPWCNGASSTYAIDILASVDSEIIDPYFTGTYSTSKFRTTAASTENYGNRIYIHAADANNPGLSGLGLIGGRNIIDVQGEDADDHRFFAQYNSSDGSRVEQVLNQRGAGFNCFYIKLINNGGTLQVSVVDGDEAATTYDGCISSTVTNPHTAVAIPDVSSGAGFGTAPAGRLSGSNSIIILNTNDNVAGEQGFIVGNIRTNGGDAIAVEPRLQSRNINGTTRVRPEFRLRNATSDATYDFDTTNFTAGQYVMIPIIGFIK